jgi:hypothetical protein
LQFAKPNLQSFVQEARLIGAIFLGDCFGESEVPALIRDAQTGEERLDGGRVAIQEAVLEGR